MRVEIRMPTLGYDMETGRVATWLRGVGESVERGDPIVEIETDKTTVEMESTHTGVLTEIIAAPGSEVEVGAVIGYIEAGD